MSYAVIAMIIVLEYSGQWSCYMILVGLGPTFTAYAVLKIQEC